MKLLMSLWLVVLAEKGRHWPRMPKAPKNYSSFGECVGRSAYLMFLSV